jgi:hypothetical protein
VPAPHSRYISASSDLGSVRRADLVLITAVDAFADELSVRNDPITYRADPAFARPQLVAVHILVGIEGVVGGLLLFGCSPVPDQPRSGQSGIVRHLAIVA